MTAVLIGIVVRGEPEGLADTLAAIDANTPERRRVVTLEDGASGGAASFNRLTAHEDADVYVLLECGARPGPGWLGRMLSALALIPQAGLAGPSTNRAWNAQCVLPVTAPNQVDPIATARTIERRFGTACRLLKPLYSLGEFCYVVTRTVVETVGEADEAYGPGPCWEMDYNVRAQRAGFKGVWVCGAYVHRAPISARRADEERELFDASKRRYQDKFCGRRLLGVKNDYRNHCRGDACPNFAPRDLIAIRIPGILPLAAVADHRPSQIASTGHTDPLASCIMPTCDRRPFIPAAVACFLAQDYSNLELVVVDDGADPIRDLLPEDDRIRYIHAPGKSPIGVKRNMACAEARGEYILHWDDDDWYGPDRVRRQIAALRERNAHVCGSSALYYYTPSTNVAYRYECGGAVAAWMGALAYPKRVWQAHPFEPIQVAEDVKFLARIPAASRIDLKDPALSVATIHAGNTSPKVTRGSFWAPEAVSTILALIAPPREMVSCIMPTWNRRAFVPLALACFRSQSYPAKELIVVDDGDDPVGDLFESAPDVRYMRLNRRISIGAKRNTACEGARGGFIAHWDDDDWYSPDRLARQIRPLAAGTHDLTGLTNNYLLEMPAGLFWNTTRDVHRRMFVGDIHGGTVVYRKDLWREGSKYPDASLAEDAALIRHATGRGKRILRIENTGEFVYLRHACNTWKFESGRFLDPSGWRRGDAPTGFTPDILEAYRAALIRTDPAHSHAS